MAYNIERRTSDILQPIIVDLSVYPLSLNGYNPESVYYVSTAGTVAGNKLILPSQEPLQHFQVFAFVEGKNEPIATMNFDFPNILPSKEQLNVEIINGVLSIGIPNLAGYYNRVWRVCFTGYNSTGNQNSRLEKFAEFEHNLTFRAIAPNGDYLALSATMFSARFYCTFVTVDGGPYLCFRLVIERSGNDFTIQAVNNPNLGSSAAANIGEDLAEGID